MIRLTFEAVPLVRVELRAGVTVESAEKFNLTVAKLYQAMIVGEIPLDVGPSNRAPRRWSSYWRAENADAVITFLKGFAEEI